MKRATVGTNVKYAIGIISIHALMKRATRPSQSKVNHALFQSTPS